MSETNGDLIIACLKRIGIQLEQIVVELAWTRKEKERKDKEFQERQSGDYYKNMKLELGTIQQCIYCSKHAQLIWRGNLIIGCIECIDHFLHKEI